MQHSFLIQLAAGSLVTGFLGYLIAIIRARGLRFDLERELATITEKSKNLEERATQLETLNQQLNLKNENLIKESAALGAQLEEERLQASKRFEEFNGLKEHFLNAFKALSSESLSKNSEEFFKQAESFFSQFRELSKEDLEKKEHQILSLIKPVGEALLKFESKITEVEKERVSAQSALREQIAVLGSLQEQMRLETRQLAGVLKSPTARGQWGEMQLRNIIQLAGMIEHCDFVEQESLVNEASERLRPDIIVNMPTGKKVVIDAKVPLNAYLEALSADSAEKQKLKLSEHAKRFKEHLYKLSDKDYASQLGDTFDFVIMFIPGEPIYSSALEFEPNLIHIGATNKVLCATPTSLIGLLRAIAYGWKQEKLTANAKLVATYGKELLGRLTKFSEHISKVGRNLDQAVGAFNEAVGSFENRVLSSARKFNDLGVSSENELPEIMLIERQTRASNNGS
ncbi:MAG TPA: DNA recombination protein RmuC [Oligoflexia bacterium]|nr:DNA recombination protein RmuC [Oligoflexia bacterium]HMP26450.1 DNA recombination protein RmuC [Oligoflexia bacterium]